MFDCPHFAKHFTPTLALFLPLFAAFPSMLFVPILDNLFTASGAIAVACIFQSFVTPDGRKPLCRFSPIGLLLGLLYLANVHIGSIFLSFHFEGIPMALSLWALAALARRRYRWFALLVLLAVGCKEDMALYWAAFGAWWTLWGWERNIKKRRLLGGVLCGFFLLWFVVAQKTIGLIAQQWGEPSFHFIERYGWMGENPAEALGFVIKRPWLLVAPLWRFAFLLLPGVLGLALLSPSTLLLLILPAWAMGLSSNFAQKDLLYYYSYPFMPFLFLGGCRGAARLLHWIRRMDQRKWIPAFSLILIVAIIWQAVQPTRMEGQRRLPAKVTMRHDWLRKQLHDLVPVDATVAAQFDLLCQLPFGVGVRPLTLENLTQSQYWVLDMRGFRGDLSREDYLEVLRRLNQALQAGEGKALINRQGLVIFRSDTNPKP